MKKLVWITSDCFIDSDLCPKILDIISKEFDIIWYVVFPKNNQRYKPEDFKEVMSMNIDVRFIKNNYRQHDLRSILFYHNLYRKIKDEKPDVIYINYEKTIFFNTLLYRLEKDITILTAHQGSVHSGFRHRWIWKVLFYLTFKNIKNVAMFTESQKALFIRNYGLKNIYLLKMSLKEFGEPTTKEKYPNITFTSFGSIVPAKNIGLLIKAAELLYEKGYRDFRVSINGACTNWDYYQSLINHPSIFTLNIGMVPNKDIPNLFSQSHFFVQPYKVVSQSGPLKIAFRYNIPVIASDLPSFKEEIVEGVNGFLFEEGNVDSLVKTMMLCIDNFQDYNLLTMKMKSYIEEIYGNETMANKMIEMFNDVIANNRKK